MENAKRDTHDSLHDGLPEPLRKQIALEKIGLRVRKQIIWTNIVSLH